MLYHVIFRLLNWSTDNNLVFNAIKTKLMLLTTAQMKACHKLDEIKDLEIACIEKQLELVNEWKLLSFRIYQHLDWKSHINKVTKVCYATLSVLKKLKIYTPFDVRKQLAESVICFQN